MNRTTFALTGAAALAIAVPFTAAATPGPNHKEWICHPVEGSGQTGHGWNLINPDKASSHIDANGVGKHTRKDGRTDVYAVAGKCPGPGNSSPPPSPSFSPSASASPTASPSVTASPSTSPTDSPSPSPSVTVTPTASPTPSSSASATPSGSASPTPSVTVTSPAPTEPTTDPTPQPTSSATATTPAPATTTTANPQRPTTARADTDQLANTGSNTWLAWIAAALLALGGIVTVAATRKANRR